jgi:8-oxo-dGTP pyrophosphatase MutT (NUDIX family)
MMGGHSTPRLASSVIVTRGAGDLLEILMGQRRIDARFMPSMRVFPGGAVEPSDLLIETPQGLSPHLQSLVAQASLPAPLHALAQAGLRETEEETGFALRMTDCSAYDLSRCDLVARAVTPEHLPIRFDTFFFHADASDLDTQTGLRDSEELLNVRWYGLEEARRGAIHRITAYMLDHFSRWLDTPAEMRRVPYLRPTRSDILLEYL